MSSEDYDGAEVGEGDLIEELTVNPICATCKFWRDPEDNPGGSIAELKYGECSGITTKQDLRAAAIITDAEWRGVNAVLRTAAGFSCSLWFPPGALKEVSHALGSRGPFDPPPASRRPGK